VEAASLTRNCLYERYIVHGTYSTVFKVCMQAAGALDRTCNCTVPVPVPGPPNETKQCQGTYYCTPYLSCAVCMLALSRVGASSYEPGPAGVPCRQGDGATERLQFITVQCVGVLRKLHRTVVPCRGPELLVNRQSSIVSSQAWAA